MGAFIDLTGQKFGRLLVLERAKNIGRQTAWLCECDCSEHTHLIIRGADLKNGHTKSCGCLRKENNHQKALNEAYNHINEKFGHLTIVGVEEKSQNNRIFYKCRCDCGNDREVLVLYKDLKAGHKTSCGCLCSKGEEKIKQILQNNNIYFETQKTFESCRFQDTNVLARFDFYVDDQYIIEFDGKQHFVCYESGWSNKDQLKRTQQHDLYKNQWCFNNNIPIIRIPYTHINHININDLKLDSTTFLIKGE